LRIVVVGLFLKTKFDSERIFIIKSDFGQAE
jgi:hypothetical protein